MRVPTYNDMLEANFKVNDETYTVIGKGLKQLQPISDAFMRIPCYVHSHPDKTAPNFAFHGYAFHKYCDLPMAFRACITLLEQGLYSDTMRLIRPLEEDLVRLRYYHKHLDQVASLVATEKNTSNQTIRIIDMWEDVGAGDAYGKIYKVSSKFGHNNLGSETSQLNMRLKGDTRMSLLPEFNLVLTGAILNMLICVSYGYLNHAPIFFSYEETSIEDSKIRDLLYSQIVSRKINFPNAAEWYEAMDKIIALSTPNNSARPSNPTRE